MSPDKEAEALGGRFKRELSVSRRCLEERRHGARGDCVCIFLVHMWVIDLLSARAQENAGRSFVYNRTISRS